MNISTNNRRIMIILGKMLELHHAKLSPISLNLTEIKCIYKLDLGKVLWNCLYRSFNLMHKSRWVLLNLYELFIFYFW